jgi:hypothetical protein
MLLLSAWWLPTPWLRGGDQQDQNEKKLLSLVSHAAGMLQWLYQQTGAQNGSDDLF